MAKHRIYTTSFASVYPFYVAKAARKGRTKAEVDEIIRWLTGYTQKGLETQLDNKTDFETFFAQAPQLNPSRALITGVVCGVKVQDIQEPVMREIRYLDKLIDELAKGKTMEKILRKHIMKPETVDDYIKGSPKEARDILETIRATIQKAAPGATEKISYGMPTFELHGNLVHFAAFKKHIGFYATPTGHDKFRKELAKYRHGKGSVQFPLDEPLQLELISKIVKFRVKENLAKAKGKK
jgi:uncharacterized protein YdhG (YjbR/CyaY superfamily)